MEINDFEWNRLYLHANRSQNFKRVFLETMFSKSVITIRNGLADQYEIFLTYFIYHCPPDEQRIFLTIIFFIAENVNDILVE